MVVGKTSLSRSKKSLNPNGYYLAVAGGLIETGNIKPIIDKNFPLEQIVEAHRYVEAGKKKGNIAISV